ncbi:MAG: CHAT domain-containing protein [Gammaproteobacteria bacterium]
MRKTLKHWSVAACCGVAGALAACGQDLSQRCEDLLAAQRFEQGLITCQQRYAQDKDALALVKAASAAAELGQMNEAQKLAEQVKDTVHAAQIYQTLARVEWRNGNHDASRELFGRSASVYRSVNDDAGLARALHSLFFFAWQDSDHRAALSLANDSLQAALRANDADAQAVALSDLYIVFQELGSLGPAHLVLELAGEKLSDTSTLSRVNYHLYRGALESKRARYGLAVHEFEQALAATRGDEQQLLLRSLQLNLVKSNMLLGRPEAARTHLATAWSHAETDGSAQFALNYYTARLDLNDGRAQRARDTLVETLASDDLPPSWVWELHYWAGKAAQQAGQNTQARASFEQSIAALEKERERLAYADLKAHLQHDRREPYEALFGLLANTGDARGALAVLEQAKARTFVDAFVADSDGTVDVTGNRVPVREVSDRADAVEAYVAAMATSPTVGTRAIEPLLAAVRDDISISYFFAERALWLVRVASGTPELHRVALSVSALEELLKANRRDPDDIPTLATLGAALLPANLLPPPGQRLFFAPDGALNQMGLASLRIDDQYLVERISLAVIPSLNTLVSMREARAAAPRTEQTVILADPHGDLPFAKREAGTVAGLLGATALTGKDASLENLATAKHADVVHIATHSGLAHLGPWVTLADGEMAASDLLEMNLAPGLAVLASCLSGASDGVGLWGSLGGVFLSTGSGSALVALWSIPDDTTQVLITDFYRAYSAQPGAAGALAAAQRMAIRNGLAPRLWAGFVLLGGVDDAG